MDSSVPGIVDKGGGCEYLRPWLGKGTKLQAGELVWMTDRTPHEALPQSTSGNRQFFRLVMPYVNHWYADHSTPNPNVPLPEHVKVIHGNKFEHHGIALDPIAKFASLSTKDGESEEKEDVRNMLTPDEERPTNWLLRALSRRKKSKPRATRRQHQKGK